MAKAIARGTRIAIHQTDGERPAPGGSAVNDEAAKLAARRTAAQLHFQRPRPGFRVVAVHGERAAGAEGQISRVREAIDGCEAQRAEGAPRKRDDLIIVPLDFRR